MKTDKKILIESLKSISTIMVSAAHNMRIYRGKETVNETQLRGANEMVHEWIETIKKENDVTITEKN